MSTILRIGEGGGLVPISFAGVDIGYRVRHAHYDGVFTVIKREIFGWTIANGKGEVHSGQSIESLSPYTRIAPETTIPKATAEQIAAIEEAIEAKKLDDAETRRAEGEQFNRDYDAALAAVKKQYPNAVQTGSGHARAAKNLKAELKKAFPLVNFSVKSESYSGGSAVRVEWTNGCTSRQVHEFSDKYSYGNFDGMEDIYNYDGSAYSRAVEKHLGAAKYVTVTRNYSDEVKAAVRENIAASYGDALNSYDLDTKVYQALGDAEIYGEFLSVEIECGANVARFAPAAHSAAVAAAAGRESAESSATDAHEFVLGEFTHTTKQTPCFAATLTSRIEKENFREITRVATSIGGYYSKFSKNGAIAGFIFPTAEKRELFLSRFK